MAAIRKQIRDRAKGLLSGSIVPAGLVGGASKPTGLTVHSFRLRPLEQESTPASIVYSGREAIERSSHSLDVLREYRLVVEHRVLGPEIEDELDELLTWATQVILADMRFNGLTIEIEEEEIEWAAEERDKVFGGAAQVFLVKYRTDIANPETKS